MKKIIRIIVLALFSAGLTVPALAEPRYASIVVDARTGLVLEAQQAESLRHPASLTKLMTLYLTFKALKSGKLRINEALRVSEYAASMAPSKLGLRPGTTIKVRDAILGLITQSANDAAVVLAEAIGGREDVFARQMTRQAKHLGMSRTLYRNASGLPDDAQVTTARDQAILARAILFNFPEYYPLFRTARFSYLGVMHENHNRLMRRYPGMDGMKTGYIRASGFNLVATAVRGKTRLIGVVFGGASARSRDRDMAGLLDQTFAWVSKNGKKLKQTPATPVPTDGKDQGPEPEDTAVSAPVAALSASAVSDAAPSAEGDSTDEESAEAVEAANRPPAPAPQYARAPVPDNNAAHATAAALATAVAAPSKGWTVQIGAYLNRSTSEKEVQKIGAHLPRQLSAARYEIIEVKTDGIKTYRARLIGLDEKSARGICRSMTQTGRGCTLVPPKA